MKNQRWNCNILFLFLYSTFPLFLFGQELVPNGDFEKHQQWNFSGSLDIYPFAYLKGWEETGLMSAVYAHADIPRRFGNRLLRENPWINFDTTLLQSGRGMIKMRYLENCPGYESKLKGCSNYIKTRLTSPLETGEVYAVSMRIYCEGHPQADSSLYDHLGLYLSRKEVTLGYHDLIPTEYFFGQHLEIKKWIEIKKYIRALCPLEHLIIGAFRTEEFPAQHLWIDNANFYYIDNVSVQKVNEDTLSAEIKPTPYCEFFEKETKKLEAYAPQEVNVHFETGSAQLTDETKATLDSFYLQNEYRKNYVFTIFGHTDNEGDDNDALSKLRAGAVENYYVEKYKLPRFKFITRGFADKKPVSNNQSSTGRAENRRVTVTTTFHELDKAVYRLGLRAFRDHQLDTAKTMFLKWLSLAPRTQQIFITADPRLKEFQQTPSWKALMAKLKKQYDIYPRPAEAYFLDSLYAADQWFRSFSMGRLTGYIPEIDTSKAKSPEPELDEFAAIDSVNSMALWKYLSNHDFPKISFVGRRQAKTACLIILHSGDSLAYEKYLPIVYDHCMEGEAEWPYYAMMYDRFQIIKDLPQLYGTQSVFINPEKTQLQLYKFDDLEQMNLRRKKWGMPPIVDPEEIIYLKQQ